MSREPEIITFGCRLNTFESEVLRRLTRESGARDLVVVNTCAVTAEAERQARKAIRRVRRQQPDARIVVTGCAAQIHSERFASMPEVDRVVGNAEKLKDSTWSKENKHRVEVGDIMTVRETAGHLLGAFEERTRAFLQVQNGCDHRCTFCIIPFGRGPSRSVPREQVIEQVQSLVADGVREVVFSGVDLTAYGQELEPLLNLGQLVGDVLDAVPELPRLRLSSLDPVEIDEALWDRIGRDPRLMPHLHLSVQAGDDTILRRMKRRHSRADVVRVVDRARELRPDIAIGADLIAGFPTETEAMFERTLALIEDCGIVYTHVFPYSERPGTPAARMPGVPLSERRERARRLREASEASHRRFLEAKIGNIEDVLLESSSIGRTRDFASVKLTRPAKPGSIVRSKIRSVSEDQLIA
ncbi:tRNA (N(6)-L-threonylcarbamoyladenosine(37)-C(2))-methylthiotransferase MtaB [Myxococcota bacterium]|nr:tRNA (N(6)-L-threonylcarbamoyladenosine(37)-C(2))-methylthiotransferase MtaB [Myxococcota bacterium]